MVSRLSDLIIDIPKILAVFVSYAPVAIYDHSIMRSERTMILDLVKSIAEFRFRDSELPADIGSWIPYSIPKNITRVTSRPRHLKRRM
jgi:hypothetical protein